MCLWNFCSCGLLSDDVALGQQTDEEGWVVDSEDARVVGVAETQREVRRRGVYLDRVEDGEVCEGLVRAVVFRRAIDEGGLWRHWLIRHQAFGAEGHAVGLAEVL